MPRRSLKPRAPAPASPRPSRRAALAARSSVHALGQLGRKPRRKQADQADQANQETGAKAAIEAEEAALDAHEPEAEAEEREAEAEEREAEEPEAEEEPEPEPEEDAAGLDRETRRFLRALAEDERLAERALPAAAAASTSTTRGRKRVAPRRFSFELPFSKSEVERIDARRLERRPPHYGHICKSVYVSNRIPVADLPVHKCTCFQEKGVPTTTRATQIATAKEQMEKPQKPAGRGWRGRKPKQAQPLLCGESCYNRMMFISCSDKTCSAPRPEMCSNRAIKRREVKPVRVEYIPGPGFGLIAEEDIQAGEFIIEYLGEVIDDEECERRLIHYRDHGETHFYMLELEKDVVIDARYRSNESRFINHSCDPNSATQKWNIDGIQRVGIFARRNIQANEEITIDYNFSHFGEAVDCKCGSTACTGKIGRKRSQIPAFVPPGLESAATAKKRVEAVEAPIPELKRPVHVSSLALLKSAQLDRQSLNTYGYKKLRLFCSHHEEKPEKSDTARSDSAKTGFTEKEQEVDKENVDNQANNRQKPLDVKVGSMSSSPLSEGYSTTSVEDDTTTSSSSSPTSSTSGSVCKPNWYDRVIRGEHLEEMRSLHSYICGGKADWSKELNRSADANNFMVQVEPPLLGNKLGRTRVSLLGARSRGVAALVAFANGKSKWNKRVPSSGKMDPDRIHRLIKHVTDEHIFFNPDQNDLNEDACYRCGLAGELICCDGCPAAFHLNCTNLVMVPPANVPWFCSECTKPKHVGGSAESASEALVAELSAASTSCYGRRQLRIHAAASAPSLKKIFHSRAPASELTKRRYKKRARTNVRSYRQLENLPLPTWSDSDASDA